MGSNMASEIEAEIWRKHQRHCSLTLDDPILMSI